MIIFPFQIVVFRAKKSRSLLETGQQLLSAIYASTSLILSAASFNKIAGYTFSPDSEMI